MPGLREKDRYFMGILRDPDASPEQKAAALYQWERESEGMDQMDPHQRGEQGFTGSASGEVMRAPWRGEFDMPGNFERRQQMANSMAEDAMLRTGLGSEYQFDPSKPVTAEIFKTSPAMAANAPEFMNTEKAYFSGPPEPSKYGMPGDTRRANRGKMMTEKEIEFLKKMIASGPQGAAMAARRYGDNPIYQYLTGAQ